MIDVWCTMPHYAAHLRPLWDGLPAEARGRWYGQTDDPEGGNVILVGAWRDLHWIGRRYRRLALVEHGIGQQYSDAADHPAYPGGNREPYDLLLAPGAHVLDPAARETVCIGPVTIEPLLGRAPSRVRAAVSFHWDGGNVSPEAGTAFWEYLPELPAAAAAVGGLMVHAHPRIQDDVFEQLEGRPGIEIVPDFATVAAEASVYAVDNSSTLFEFAALDRPVVVINGSHMRRDVRHGKRFWEWADIGRHVNRPGELGFALHAALRGEDPHDDRRRAIVADVYQGNTHAGVRALLRLAE